MSIKMSASLRKQIIATAKPLGFNIVLKDGVNDLYDKLLTFRHRKLSSNITIDKSTGISKGGGLGYLKVVVHPDIYSNTHVNTQQGIEPLLNRRTKKNQHSHSGYQGLSYAPEHKEPTGKAYSVQSNESLKSLLAKLTEV